jgi:phosphoribosylaminoimidazole-succinocarboxamide synthase
MNSLTNTNYNFPGQTNLYHGKVRDVYSIGDDILVMIATDRISAFDVVLPKGIPYKGQVLNQIASKFLDATSDIVPNWKIASPDPMVTIGTRCEPFKVEMVIRGYITGSAWRDYKKGARSICGIQLPEGLRENQRFETPIITPTTKADEGHDENISKEEIIAQGLVSKEDYEQLEKYTYELFKRGTEMAKEKGLILVDTKYEFGKKDGKIYLIDEIHTPDSSRYFYSDGKELEQSRGTISEITQQIWNFIGQYKLNNNISDTDILITPDVYPFGMMDFHKTAIDTIIQRGFTAAIEHRDELTKLKKSLSIDTNFYNQTKKRNPYLELDTLTINNIYVEGITQRERSYLNRWIDNYNGSITREELDNMISKIYGSGMFDRVYYRFEGEDPFDLIITVDVKEANRLNLGIHFDSNDLAAILANTTIRLNSSLNSMFDITTRLSRDPFLMIDYSINRGIFFKGGINYKIGKNDLSIYDRGKLLYNLGITRNSLNLVFSEFYFGNIMLHLGAQMEHFHFYKAMGSVFESPQSELNDLLYFNYLLNGVYDNLNKDFFPTSGLYFSFQYSLHTDNFVSMENEAPLNVVRMKMLKPFSLSDKVFITPRITARYIMNDSVPRMYRNLVGGRTDGHYMPQQISLQGSTGMEFLENMVFSTDVNIHYNFTTNNYLYTNLNFTIHNNHLHTLLEGDSFLGVNLGYSYLTVAGPLRLELGYSELSRRFHPYVSYGYYF